MKADMEFVSSNARIPFRCQKCAECCRHVEDALMLEPLDIYRLSRYLRKQEEGVNGPEDVLDRYAHPTLIEGLPIYQLNSVGDDHACVFLKDGRCAVYDARPQVCRMYPFGTAPGSRGKDFNFYLCTERRHHFGAGSVRVKDWLSENLFFQLLYYLYFGYDLEKPFLPQYEENMTALKKVLEQECG